MTREKRLLRLRLAVGAGLFLLTLAVRLLPALWLKNEIGDMAVYRLVATAVREGDNVYAYPVTFPYAPYSQFLPAGVLAIAERTGWPFRVVLKSVVIFADACGALLIFGCLLRRGVPLRLSAGWTLAWALNPISILVSAFHGNVMPIAPLLVLAAYVTAALAETRRDRDLLLPVSALLLGLGIAMRSYPALLLPVFLMLFTRTAVEIALFSSLAALPAGLSSLPYLLLARPTFLRETLGYSGVADFGWLSVLRALAWIFGGPRSVDVHPALIDWTKPLFLLAYLLVCLGMPYFRRASLGRALLIAPLLFYGLYGGVSAQYLVWVLPLAACSRDRLLFPFTLVGTAALIPFYSIYHDGVLTGGLPSPIHAEDPTVWIVYGAANASLVVLSLAWVARIVGAELASYRRLPRRAPVPWLRAARRFWSGRGYAAAVLLLSAGWLVLAWHVLRQARDFAKEILGWVVT